MENYKIAAYACFVACENKTRRFFYNDHGVFEGIWKGYDKICFDNFSQIVGKPILIDSKDFEEFYRSLRWGHDGFGKDKTHPTKDLLLAGDPTVKKPINPEAA